MQRHVVGVTNTLVAVCWMYAAAATHSNVLARVVCNNEITPPDATD